MADVLITQKEAARVSGLDSKTIRARCKSGFIARDTPAGLTQKRISKNSLDDFMAFIRPIELSTKKYLGNGKTNADPTAHAYLYEIYDSKDGQCIYVGYSKNAKTRISQHKSDLNRGMHRNRQLQNLHKARNGKLKYKIAAEGMSQLMLDMEKRAIAELRSEIGNRLCNATDGGDGFDSLPKTTKEAIAKNSRDKWRDDEYRRRWYTSQGKPFVSYQDSVLEKWAKACEAVQRACDRAGKNLSRATIQSPLCAEDFIWIRLGNRTLIPLTQGLWASIPQVMEKSVRSVSSKWHADTYNRRMARPIAGGSNKKVSMPHPWQIVGQPYQGPTAGECAHCGYAFIGRFNALYCSSKCQKKARDKRKRLRISRNERPDS